MPLDSAFKSGHMIDFMLHIFYLNENIFKLNSILKMKVKIANQTCTCLLTLFSGEAFYFCAVEKVATNG